MRPRAATLLLLHQRPRLALLFLVSRMPSAHDAEPWIRARGGAKVSIAGHDEMRASAVDGSPKHRVLVDDAPQQGLVVLGRRHVRVLHEDTTSRARGRHASTAPPTGSPAPRRPPPSPPLPPAAGAHHLHARRRPSHARPDRPPARQRARRGNLRQARHGPQTRASAAGQRTVAAVVLFTLRVGSARTLAARSHAVPRETPAKRRRR